MALGFPGAQRKSFYIFYGVTDPLSSFVCGTIHRFQGATVNQFIFIFLYLTRMNKTTVIEETYPQGIAILMHMNIMHECMKKNQWDFS